MPSSIVKEISKLNLINEYFSNASSPNFSFLRFRKPENFTDLKVSYFSFFIYCVICLIKVTFKQ